MSHESWNYFIGDLKEGRKNLGESMPVAIYRLFEFTMKEILVKKYGTKEANLLFQTAGKSAGIRFAHELLDLTLDLNDFIASLQLLMEELKIGILRIEEVDIDLKSLVVTVAEDLDCSGLSIIGEAVCNYDEGFLSGILFAYTNNDYEVVEIDCWAKGGRVCRFKADLKTSEN